MLTVDVRVYGTMPDGKKFTLDIFRRMKQVPRAGDGIFFAEFDDPAKHGLDAEVAAYLRRAQDGGSIALRVDGVVWGPFGADDDADAGTHADVFIGVDADA